MARAAFMPGGAPGVSQAVNGYVRGLSAGTWNTPDTATVSILGDIDLDGKLRIADWAAGNCTVLAKDDGNTGRSYCLQIATGKIRFYCSVDGTTLKTADSTALLSTVYINNTANWVRATYVAATGTVTFYISADGITWATLGATVPLAAGAIFDSTSLLYVLGNALTASTGDIYRARAYNGLRQSAGVLAADFDPRRYTSGTTFTAATGEVWTTTGPLPRYS